MQILAESLLLTGVGTVGVATDDLMSIDSRHRHIAKVLKQQFPLSDHEIEDVIIEERNNLLLRDFFHGDERVPKLLFFYQTRDSFGEDGEMIEAADTDAPQLFMSTGDLDRQKSSGVYFLRNKKAGADSNDDAVGTSSPEQDMSYGILPPSAFEGLQTMLAHLYMPLITQTSGSWQKVMGAEDSTAEFYSNYKKFSETLSEAVSSLQGGFTLRRPERLFDIENKAAAFNRAGTEPEVVQSFEAVAEEWCTETEKLLAESDTGRQESDDAGPETELEYWRNRMAKFNSITEQLKGRECKVVLGVLGAAKSRVLKRWKLLDNSVRGGWDSTPRRRFRAAPRVTPSRCHPAPRCA